MNATSQQARAALAQADPSQAKTWARLAALEEPAPIFWEQYIQAVGQSLQARRVLLLVSGIGQPWKALAQWPSDAVEVAGDADGILQTLGRASVFEPRVETLSNGDQALALRFQSSALGTHPVAAVVALQPARLASEVSDLIAWAQEVVLVPQSYAQHNAQRDPGTLSHPAQSAAVGVDEPHAQRLYEILRLQIALTRQKRFMQMAFELCNALAVKCVADRVSLGWVEGPYVRLTAISHVEKFDPHATLSRALESAMEEAADQAQPLAFPLPEGSRQVSRAHESYALMQGVAAVVSVPLRGDLAVQGVICLEKRHGRWSEDELWELGLVAELVVHPMADLKARDRWWGARWAGALKTAFQQSISPKHSGWKLAGLSSLVVLLLLFVWPWAYRVDATLTLRSKDLLFMPAPFDGYLRQVQVEIGDKVEAGQVLVQLDTRDLVLEESMAEADVLRYGREAEKAQAARQLAEMQINLARQEQSASRLALVRHQLQHAKVTAPHAGVVVEGELKKNLGAPLRKGDLLLKLAHTDDTYLELEIDQVDVHEVRVGSTGEFALVGRPDQRFAIQLERIDPASTLREGRNIYLARAKVQSQIPPWWRPGMGGSARIDAGDRPLIWVLTHRTVRFLRELFWV